MAIRVMTLVWDVPWPTQSALLIALKMADRSNDEGSEIWPSQKALMKASLTSESTVKRILKSFVRVGILKVVELGGKRPGHTTEYVMNLRLLAALRDNEAVLSGTNEDLAIHPESAANDYPFPMGSTVNPLRNGEGVQESDEGVHGDSLRGPHGDLQNVLLDSSIRTKKIRSSIEEQKKPPKAAAVKVAAPAAARPIFEITPDQPQWQSWIAYIGPNGAGAAILAGRIHTGSKCPRGEHVTWAVPEPNVRWLNPAAKPALETAQGGAA